MNKVDFNSRLQFITDQFQFFSTHTNFSADVCLFIASQFALESYFGISNLAVSHHNLCGMRKPNLRFSLASGVHNNFSVYADLDACRYDYLVWLSWNHIPYNISLSAFESRLKSLGYCPDSDYTLHIEVIYEKFKPYFKVIKL